MENDELMAIARSIGKKLAEDDIKAYRDAHIAKTPFRAIKSETFENNELDKPIIISSGLEWLEKTNGEPKNPQIISHEDFASMYEDLT